MRRDRIVPRTAILSDLIARIRRRMHVGLIGKRIPAKEGLALQGG